MKRTRNWLQPRGWVRNSLALGLALGGGLWLAAPAARAQSADPQGPALYRIEGVSNSAARSRVAATGALIIEAQSDAVLVEATPEERQSLEKSGLKLLAPGAGDGVRVQDFPRTDSAFHDYAEMTAQIRETARRFPEIFSLSSIGQSEQGRTIWLGKISDRVKVDEDEPEFLFTHHQHAREHLTVEQGLYTLQMLTEEYGSNPLVTDLVNEREIWMIFDVNPDGGEFDIETGDYVSWRKNRQQNGSASSIGTDLNRNWDFRFGCCGGSSAAPNSGTYRGAEPFSAPETDLIRRFVDSRVVRGEQQISAAIDFHSFSELVLWPYGYTEDDVPADMDRDDQAAFVAMGKRMGALNDYTPEQSSDLYITDGSIIDWLYGEYGIFAYTLEMYPKDNAAGGFYPGDEVIERETERNREAILYLIEQSDCPFRSIRKEREICGIGADDDELAPVTSAARGRSRVPNRNRR